MFNKLIRKNIIINTFFGASLIKLILAGLLAGIAVGLWLPELAVKVEILGSLFIGALKAVAPILVFLLVTASIANQSVDSQSHIKPILVLYVVGTTLASFVAVAASFLFPVSLELTANAQAVAAPKGVAEVFHNVLMNMVDNPIRALSTGNYIGILVWACAFGVALRYANKQTRVFMSDLAKGIENIVRVVIRFAPVGIFGLVSTTVEQTGLSVLVGYAEILAVLLGTMVFVALIVNPALTWLCIRKNPYPLVMATLKESAVTAFFTRSSAANIPVNMALCKRLDLHENTYSVSIPLGATVNMAGAAVTISVLSLAAANSVGIHPDLPTAFLLALLAAFCACGASGVPGGSLMLIPLACSLFGMSDTIAMEVVAVGFIIGVLQDSAETALNSSSDVLFTASACLRAERLARQKKA